MRRFLFCFVVMIMSLILGVVSATDTVSLRNGITFASSKDEVMKLETFPEKYSPYATKNSLTFGPGTMANVKDCVVQYQFDDSDRLIKIWIRVGQKPDYITLFTNYKKINSALIEKYGKPLGYRNGKTYSLISSNLDNMLYMKDLASSLGGKFEYEYDEWVIKSGNNIIKIDHVCSATKGKNGTSCTHELLYSLFSTDSLNNNDI